MHLLPRAERSMLRAAMRSRGRWTQTDRLRGIVVGLASRIANYRNFCSGPRVTLPKLVDGGVGVALSVLYSPFDELDIRQKYPGQPQPDYLDTIIRQLEMVQGHVEENHQDVARVAVNPAELDAAINAGKIAIVHCIEGGFQVGASPDGAAEAVHALAQRGVAYITIAHLFYRKVATNANAIPFIPQRVYDHFWPQPERGLTSLGEAVIRAMADEGVLIDVTHMSERALSDTFDLLDDIDKGKQQRTPVLASHGAVRLNDKPYNLSERTIARIGERGGVIGLILSEKLMTPVPEVSRTSTLSDSLKVLFHHINEIHRITRSHRHTAIGTDLDGFIKPTLAGLGDAAELSGLESALIEKYPDDAELITSGNALGLLQDHWSGGSRDP